MAFTSALLYTSPVSAVTKSADVSTRTMSQISWPLRPDWGKCLYRVFQELSTMLYRAWDLGVPSAFNRIKLSFEAVLCQATQVGFDSRINKHPGLGTP
jgi:hypothetical protein